MCGSSSTTTTVPLSAPTFLAFHLLHPELPEYGIPSQNHDDCRTPCSPALAHDCLHPAPDTTGARTRGVTHAARTHPIGSARRHRPGLRGHAGRRGRHGGRRHGEFLGQQRRQRGPGEPWPASRPRRPRTSPIGSTTSTRRSAKVNAAKGLGASQATLVSYLGTDIAPLQQLNQTIQGDSTLQQAAHDFGTIFSDYRVYRLVLPAARDRRRGRPRHDLGHPEPHRRMRPRRRLG